MATLRRATPADALALADLRGHMYVAMGVPLTDAWHERCVADFSRRLDTPGFVAFVIEAEGEVVSGGAGWLEEHLPSPTQLDGRRGHIASMSTHPAHRRQGHARVVFAALMEHFTAQGIGRVDLRETPDGQPLYASFGFRVLGGATMAWNTAGTSPGLGVR